jgi:hypothetical protein
LALFLRYFSPGIRPYRTADFLPVPAAYDSRPKGATESTLLQQLKNIQEIEQELSRGVRASSIATGEESPLVSYKRAASTNLPYSAKRALAPSVYEGTNLRELRDFLLGCEIYFDAVEEHKDRRRIVIATSYLRRNTLRQ